MPQHVKLGILGTYKEVEEKESTHVLLTADEYLGFFLDVFANREAAEKVNKQYVAERREKERLEQSYQAKLQEAEKQSKALMGDLRRMEQELAQVKKQNDHLARINKERANADRGLQPKKKHTGYVLISSRDPRKNQKNRTTTLQTPFKLAVPHQEVIKQVTADLKGYLGKAIGLDCPITLDPVVKARIGEIKNEAIDIRLQASSRDGGFWEVVFDHRDPLKFPPEVLPMPKE